MFIYPEKLHSKGQLSKMIHLYVNVGAGMDECISRNQAPEAQQYFYEFYF